MWVRLSLFKRLECLGDPRNPLSSVSLCLPSLCQGLDLVPGVVVRGIPVANILSISYHVPATVGTVFCVHYFIESLLRGYWSEEESIALKEGKVLELINEFKRSIIYQLPRLQWQNKGHSGENWSLSTFGGLQREMDRVGVGPSSVTLSINPHCPHLPLNRHLPWLNDVLSATTVITTIAPAQYILRLRAE